MRAMVEREMLRMRSFFSSPRIRSAGKIALTHLTPAPGVVVSCFGGTLGAIDGQTAEWLKAIDDKLRDRLARVGPIDLPGATLLGSFLDSYIDQRRRRGDVTDSTIEVWGHTRRNLKTYFGPDKEAEAVARESVCGSGRDRLPDFSRGSTSSP